MDTIKQVLMRRDRLSESEAIEMIDEAKKALEEYLDAGDIAAAEDICQELFGLEPDYLFDLLD